VLLQVLEAVKVSKEVDRDTLIQLARTSLRTKVHRELADLKNIFLTHIFFGEGQF
jgi:hypothetical protein